MPCKLPVCTFLWVFGSAVLPTLAGLLVLQLSQRPYMHVTHFQAGYMLAIDLTPDLCAAVSNEF